MLNSEDAVRPPEPPDPADELWNSSASASQIRALGNVETEIATLLELAASAVKLLALPPLPSEEKLNGDGGDAGVEAPAGALTAKEDLATGEERSELFVEKANQYFDTLDSIQYQLRRALYDLRLKRISPSSINAPPADFVPRPLGVGPSSVEGPDQTRVGQQGLQETRVERQAWMGIVQALEMLKLQRTEQPQPQSQAQAQAQQQQQNSASDDDMETSSSAESNNA